MMEHVTRSRLGSRLRLFASDSPMNLDRTPWDSAVDERRRVLEGMRGALCRDVHAAALPRFRRRPHDDLDVPTQRIEKIDEPLRGEATEPATEEM